MWVLRADWAPPSTRVLGTQPIPLLPTTEGQVVINEDGGRESEMDYSGECLLYGFP